MQTPFGIWEFATALFITAFLLWHFWVSRRHWLAVLLEGTEESRSGNRLILFIARGAGLGLLPKAPGTWGSVGGLAWAALLLTMGNIWLYLAGVLVGFALSIWICGRAEKILRKIDPSEIVLDEIVAVPMCFIGLLATQHFGLQLLLQPVTWCWASAGFALFRLFDIWKPPPIHQLQNLPGGWGVNADDLMAAIYTAVILQSAWQFFY